MAIIPVPFIAYAIAMHGIVYNEKMSCASAFVVLNIACLGYISYVGFCRVKRKDAFPGFELIGEDSVEKLFFLSVIALEILSLLGNIVCKYTIFAITVQYLWYLYLLSISVSFFQQFQCFVSGTLALVYQRLTSNLVPESISKLSILPSFTSPR